MGAALPQQGLYIKLVSIRTMAPLGPDYHIVIRQGTKPLKRLVDEIYGLCVFYANKIRGVTSLALHYSM